MTKIYNVSVTNDNFKGLKYNQVVSEDKVKSTLEEIAPDCKIDFERVFTDKRCRYFQHYMPVNKTTAKHSYKENNKLFKSGNNVKVYISEYVNFDGFDNKYCKCELNAIINQDGLCLKCGKYTEGNDR